MSKNKFKSKQQRQLEKELYYDDYRRRFVNKNCPVYLEEKQVNFYSHGVEYCIKTEWNVTLDDDQIEDIKRIIKKLL